MKEVRKILVTAGAIMFSIVSSAQTPSWTYSTDLVSLSPASANVSIGLSTSPAKLNIKPSVSTQAALQVYDYSGSTKLLLHSNGGLSVGSSTTPPLNGLFVSGKVGIGMASPLTTLDIAGNMRATKIFSPEIGAFDGYFTIYDGKSLNDYSISWVSDSWTNGGPTLWQSSWGGMKFFTEGQVRMSITREGNMGIGTISPQAKLHVTGKILCEEEIRVATINTDEIKTKDIRLEMNDVADYVFGEDYELKPLEEVEYFVKINKHLPGVPSGKEMETNGVSQSHMNNILLEKIEELTLYLIDLKKQNEELRSRMDNLNK